VDNFSDNLSLVQSAGRHILKGCTNLWTKVVGTKKSIKEQVAALENYQDPKIAPQQ